MVRFGLRPVHVYAVECNVCKSFQKGRKKTNIQLYCLITGSPRTGSPVGRLSPRQTRTVSLTDSPSYNSIKDDLFSTPPDSPINATSKRMTLKKDISGDRPTHSPPTSPSIKHKQMDVNKIVPPSGQGILSPARRDSFGGAVSPVRSTR